MKYPLDRLDLACMALIALALATIVLVGVVGNPALLNGAVLAIAAVKGRRILLDYLGLRSAPALWRGLVSAWLILIVGFGWAVPIVSALLS
jgi:hypothetical protein